MKPERFISEDSTLYVPSKHRVFVYEECRFSHVVFECHIVVLNTHERSRLLSGKDNFESSRCFLVQQNLFVKINVKDDLAEFSRTSARNSYLHQKSALLQDIHIYFCLMD